ncbi:MAG TPA: hypothetical protein PLS67_12120, partial [Accumulibacter sp.]|nr:hypothetical protein [Accumulibacter sp.]
NTTVVTIDRGHPAGGCAEGSTKSTTKGSSRPRGAAYPDGNSPQVRREQLWGKRRRLRLNFLRGPSPIQPHAGTSSQETERVWWHQINKAFISVVSEVSSQLYR